MREFKPEMVIWDADKVSKRELRRVVDSGALPTGTMIGLGRLFLEWHSKNIIKYCQERGYPVFCDAQILGEPDKCMAMTEAYLRYRPTVLSIVASACNTGNVNPCRPDDIDMLKRFADVCASANVRSCAVVMPTSKDWLLSRWEYHVNGTDQAMRYVSLVHRTNMTDILCSASVAARICDNSIYRRLTVNVSGLNPVSDREVPKQCADMIWRAIEYGADRLVIGETMTSGDGPIEDRVARNYAVIRRRVEQSIAEVNAKLSIEEARP